jgi:hypothetical protein
MEMVCIVLVYSTNLSRHAKMLRGRRLGGDHFTQWFTFVTEIGYRYSVLGVHKRIQWWWHCGCLLTPPFATLDWAEANS